MSLLYPVAARFFAVRRRHFRACGPRLLLGCLLVSGCLAPAACLADEQAEAALKDMAVHYAGLESLSGTLTLQEQKGEAAATATARASLQKPNLGHIAPVSRSIKKTDARPTNVEWESVSDGTTLWLFNKDFNAVIKSPNGVKPDGVGGPVGLLHAFYKPDEFLQMLTLNKPGCTTTAHLSPEQKVGGIPCQVVEINTVFQNGTGSSTIKIMLFIGVKDRLLRRAVRDQTDILEGRALPALHYAETLTDIRANPKLPVAEFTFTPPAEARIMQRSALLTAP